jgi:Domain of unknown function (DUF927)
MNTKRNESDGTLASHDPNIKKKKVKPKKPPRPAPTVFDNLSPDLPDNLVINSVVDNVGRHTGQLLLSVANERDTPVHAILPIKDLAQGRCDDLAHFAVRARLFGQLSPKRLRAMAATLTEYNGGDVCVVHREGFQRLVIRGQRYDLYVLGGKVHFFGSSAPVEIVVINEAVENESSGDLESWHAAIGVHLADNPYMLVSVLAALAPALARALGLHIPILAIVAPSSLGKTTLQQIGRSTRECADKIDDASGTTNGLRVMFEQHPDVMIFLQDVHKVEDLAGFMGLLFLVANGGHRLTSTSDQKAVAGAELACGLSLSMEMTFLEMLGNTKISLPEGFSARCFEMVLQGQYGAFHALPDGVAAHDFANQIKRACGEHYGAVWAAWIPAIAKNAPYIREKLPKVLQAAEASLLEGLDIKDRVTLRLVSGLAVWLAVGKLAIKLKVLKLKPEAVTEAMKLVVREYVRRQAHRSTPIGEKVISTVRDLIDRNSNRFPALSMFNRDDQNNVLGYTKGSAQDLFYLFLPGVLEEVLGEKFGLQMALQKLHEAGYLVKNGEGSQIQVRVAGRRKRFYGIRSSIRFDGDEIEAE